MLNVLSLRFKLKNDENEKDLLIIFWFTLNNRNC